MLCFNNCTPDLRETQPVIFVYGFYFLCILPTDCVSQFTPRLRWRIKSWGKQRESSVSHISELNQSMRMAAEELGLAFAWEGVSRIQSNPGLPYDSDAKSWCHWEKKPKQQTNKVPGQLQRLWGHIKEGRFVGFHIQKMKLQNVEIVLCWTWTGHSDLGASVKISVKMSLGNDTWKDGYRIILSDPELQWITAFILYWSKTYLTFFLCFTTLREVLCFGHQNSEEDSSDPYSSEIRRCYWTSNIILHCWKSQTVVSTV